MPAHIYLIKAITNLHVGSGDSSYGIIDKLIQRDATNQLPTIFGQSLKGSLREYFGKQLDMEKTNAAFLQAVFGSPVRRADGKDPEQGNLTFTSADLLTIPVPDTNPHSLDAYYLQGSEVILDQFLTKASAFGIKGDWKAKLKEMLGVKSEHWNELAFKQAAGQVPVIARNYLESGISKNLWYEEFLPHQSVFGVIFYSPREDHWDTLKAHLNGKVVQLGANATVGYGYCQFTQLT
jgi:CRISPR-associated protein Cmr4